MTENTTNSDTTAAEEMLKLARQATARIITAAIEATAESADMERAAVARKFPALASLPAPLKLDPQQIRDFTKTAAFDELIEQYVAGRLEGHLLSRVFDLIQKSLPLLLAS